MKKLWGHIIYYREEAMQKTLHKRITVKKKTFYILCLVFSVLGLSGITYGCSKKSDSSVQSKEINVDVVKPIEPLLVTPLGIAMNCNV